jgi:hypothetical protein
MKDSFEQRERGEQEFGCRSTERIESPIPDSLRCLQCNEPVPNAVCGRKSPCPACGFPYPLGDCSDLAEN